MATNSNIICISLIVIFLFCHARTTRSKQATIPIRRYYIAALEIEWDYTPRGLNLVNNNSENTTVSIYKKAVYRGYTDATFSEEISHPSWLGLLGPTIKGETGDVIEIVFKNLAKARNYTVHPHGVFYAKDSEGARYKDETEGKDKADDGVPPGGTVTYVWNITEKRGPQAKDPACQTWAYHSHLSAELDMYSGLTGALLICKKGILDENTKRLDVDHEYILLFEVIDEGLSWYFDENQKRYLAIFPNGELDFLGQSARYSINGYLFGNLPDLTMCVGQTISWHLIGLGSIVDIHTAYFHGNTLIQEGHRTDTMNFLPATFATGIMHAVNIGKWLISCQVNDHLKAGMEAFYEVQACSKFHSQPKISTFRTREYFISAEEVTWDYAPSGRNLMTGLPLEKDEYGIIYAMNINGLIGRKYKKVKFVQYTDITFSKKSTVDKFLGILGPVIRGEEGDLIKVHFHNKANQSYSIIAHGVFYDKSNEGMKYNDKTEGSMKKDDSVSPGDTYTYNWYITPDVAPTKLDPNCLTWWYTSGVNSRKDSQSGLNGILLTCKKGTLDQQGKQIGVKEFPLMFSIFEENLSWYWEENLQHYSNVKVDDFEMMMNASFLEPNRKYNINGYILGNLQGIEACKDDVISWHILQKGYEANVHNVYFHGNNFKYNGQNLDSAAVFPGVGHTVIMKAHNTGIWALECRTTSHLDPGMRALYKISKCHSQTPLNSDSDGDMDGIVRTYYIAAVERVWNYVNTDIDIITEEKLSENELSRPFITRNGTNIGSEYKKVLFRQFTDETFLKEIPQQKHLSILGPLIKAEVGDIIKVVFKNLATRNYSIHPHGVTYNKSNEGWRYNDGGPLYAGDAVVPGSTFTYVWSVPKIAGPSKDDFNCSTWAYYSAVDAQKDINSGLLGPLIVCKRGTLDKTGKRRDVENEFPLLFTIFDENLSWYIEENIKTYALAPVNRNDFGYLQSNRKFSINGFLYGRVNGLIMQQNAKVAWYLMSVGSNFDVHTVHFHGQTVVRFMDSYHVDDVINLYPGTFLTVEMTPDNPGIWLLHCHINYHSVSGMTTLFEVKPIKEESNSHKITLEGRTHIKSYG